MKFICDFCLKPTEETFKLYFDNFYMCGDCVEKNSTAGCLIVEKCFDCSGFECEKNCKKQNIEKLVDRTRMKQSLYYPKQQNTYQSHFCNYCSKQMERALRKTDKSDYICKHCAKSKID